jgi:hypothetical protein
MLSVAQRSGVALQESVILSLIISMLPTPSIKLRVTMMYGANYLKMKMADT